jgi:hypothetical protein
MRASIRADRALLRPIIRVPATGSRASLGTTPVPDLPPSPLHRARWKRARRWRLRILILKHLVNLVTMLAVIACIAFVYHALTIYGAREGYAPHSVRLEIAVFLAGGLVGALVVYYWLAGKRR